MANTTKLNTENVFTGSKVKHYQKSTTHILKTQWTKGGITIDGQTLFWYLPLRLEFGAGQQLLQQTCFRAGIPIISEANA